MFGMGGTSRPIPKLFCNWDLGAVRLAAMDVLVEKLRVTLEEIECHENQYAYHEHRICGDGE